MNVEVLDQHGTPTGWTVTPSAGTVTTFPNREGVNRGHRFFLDPPSGLHAELAFLVPEERERDDRLRSLAPRSDIERAVRAMTGGTSHEFDWEDLHRDVGEWVLDVRWRST